MTLNLIYSIVEQKETNMPENTGLDACSNGELL